MIVRVYLSGLDVLPCMQTVAEPQAEVMRDDLEVQPGKTETEALNPKHTGACPRTGKKNNPTLFADRYRFVCIRTAIGLINTEAEEAEFISTSFMQGFSGTA